MVGFLLLLEVVHEAQFFQKPIVIARPPEGEVLLILAAKASKRAKNTGSPDAGWNALTVGKFVDNVMPVTYADPDASAAMAVPCSLLPPPR